MYGGCKRQDGRGLTEGVERSLVVTTAGQCRRDVRRDWGGGCWLLIKLTITAIWWPGSPGTPAKRTATCRTCRKGKEGTREGADDQANERPSDPNKRQERGVPIWAARVVTAQKGSLVRRSGY